MTDIQRFEEKRLVDWALMTYGSATSLDWIRANHQRLREEMRQNPFAMPPAPLVDRYSEMERE